MDIMRIKIIQPDRQWKIVISVLFIFLDYIIEEKVDKEGSGLFAILDGHGGN
jgi:hypothetical protein